MELCRLCGEDKQQSELVTSLDEENEIITFKELIEYYCRIELNSDKNLPQKVCKTCGDLAVMFTHFILKVDQTQTKLQAIKAESVIESTSCNENEKATKKIKLDADADDDLIVEMSQTVKDVSNEFFVLEPEPGPAPIAVPVIVRQPKARRKSVYLERVSFTAPNKLIK